MNLLGIQDALKNASDQQLMQLMQAPDSTAPSYLVLSELRRRKDMRSQQAQPPQGTVAQDLTSEENMQAPMGIRSLSTPEPGDEEYPTEEDAPGIEAMREGGVIRMAAGTPDGVEGDGDPSLFRQLITPTPTSDEEMRFRSLRSTMSTPVNPLNQLFGGQREYGRNAENLNFLDQNRDKFLRGELDFNAFERNPIEYRRSIEAARNQPAVDAAPLAPIDPGSAAPATQPQSRPATTPAVTPPRGAQPATSRPGGAGGIGAMAAGAPAAAAPAALPTIAQNMERNLELFPGIPPELMDRIRASRTNEGDRRREAQNMALVEAGLRMAASNNPRLGAAFAEGAAPAVQSYTQQLSQIRQDQNADITRELSVAQADLQRRYMAGQISAAELQRQTQMLEIAARERQSIRAEGIAASRFAASEANADARLTRQESAATAGREHTARMNAIRDVNKEVSDTMGDTMRREAIRSSLRQAGQPAPTDAQILTALRRDAMNRIFPDYGLQIPTTISDSARPGATVQSGVPR